MTGQNTSKRITVSAVLPRPWERGTFAFVTAELFAESELSERAIAGYDRVKKELGGGDIQILKELLKRGVSHWVLNTERGHSVWRRNNRDFNIGDAAEWAGEEEFDAALRLAGIARLNVTTYSDKSDDAWDFDDALVTEEVEEIDS